LCLGVICPQKLLLLDYRLEWQEFCPSRCTPILFPGSYNSYETDRPARDIQEATEDLVKFSERHGFPSSRTHHPCKTAAGRQLLNTTLSLALRRTARCGQWHTDVQSGMTVYWERHSAMQVRRLTPDNTRHGVCALMVRMAGRHAHTVWLDVCFVDAVDFLCAMARSRRYIGVFLMANSM
jgi:hypothetical protein